MQPIDIVQGPCLPVDADDVDTDQIIPARHLLRLSRTGLGAFAFERSGVRPMVEARSGAPILLGGRNFGCGSSREHAVWALADRGVRVVIAPSLADIFAGNCARYGVLALALPESIVGGWRGRSMEDPGFSLRVDLRAQSVDDGEATHRFAVDPFARRCLLEGLDPIAVTLGRNDAIARYERTRPGYRPRIGGRHA